MDPVKAKSNFARISQLLVDKGGDALRAALHVKHPPATLAAVLNANKPVLQKLRYSVIKASQWNLLYPPTGTAPDSNNFDITLLTILLRNICGLPSPAAGWNAMPPASDTSISADILRIKIYRNEVYGHIASAQYDDTEFDTLWQEISQPLTKLGVLQQDIDELKVASLSPEEESYIGVLKEWKEEEDKVVAKLNDVERKVDDVKVEVVKLREAVENRNLPQVDQLAKFDFTGKIEALCEKFQDGTREWFFDELSTWFTFNDESRVMILTAGPGVGKSVLAAEICKRYEDQLAACHFCDYKFNDYKNPHRILQSISKQMCDSIPGFAENLNRVLTREHSRELLSDAFRVFLHDPLFSLSTVGSHDQMLIVIDALDESKTNEKSELLELISEEFPQLPRWIKVVITSRAELPIRVKLKDLRPLEIRPDDRDHNRDLRHFISKKLHPDFTKNSSGV